MGACCSAGAREPRGKGQPGGSPGKGRRYRAEGAGGGAGGPATDYLGYTDNDNGSGDEWDDGEGRWEEDARRSTRGGVDISFAGDTLLGHVDLNSLEDRLPRDESAEECDGIFAMAQLRARGVYATLLSDGCSEPAAVAKLMASLRSIKAVSSMPEEIVRMLAKHMVLVSVPAGSVLVDKGDIFSLIYVVGTGVLERGEETSVSKASRLSHVARLSLIKEMSGPWEVVGHVGNLVGGRSPCNLFARVDSEIWMIEREAVMNVCANHTRERSEKLLPRLPQPRAAAERAHGGRAGAAGERHGDGRV